jgi:hypothetical protein
MHFLTFVFLLDTAFIAVSKNHFFINKNTKKMSTSWRTNSLKTFLTQLTVGVSKKYILKNANLYLEFYRDENHGLLIFFFQFLTQLEFYVVSTKLLFREYINV